MTVGGERKVPSARKPTGGLPPPDDPPGTATANGNGRGGRLRQQAAEATSSEARVVGGAGRDGQEASSCPTGGGCAARAGWKPALPRRETAGGDRCPRPTERPAGDDSASAASYRSNNGVAPGGARRAGGKLLPHGRRLRRLRRLETCATTTGNGRRGSVSPRYRTATARRV